VAAVSAARSPHAVRRRLVDAEGAGDVHDGLAGIQARDEQRALAVGQTGRRPSERRHGLRQCGRE